MKTIKKRLLRPLHHARNAAIAILSIAILAGGSPKEPEKLETGIKTASGCDLYWWQDQPLAATKVLPDGITKSMVLEKMGIAETTCFEVGGKKWQSIPNGWVAIAENAHGTIAVALFQL
ncbi:MAG: hypothetical protein EHM45_15445, partial [Desulfobacteraceae bacterium]